MILSRGLPSAPPDVREEVELYARQHGRTGSVAYVPYPVNAWEARLSLRPNDPAMKAWQEGRAEEPPVETVLFVEPNPKVGQVEDVVLDGQRIRHVHGPYRALDIVQMGASGVRQFLERGNTWSGRGEHRSIDAARQHAENLNRAKKEKARADAIESAKHRAREDRVWWSKKPHEKSPMQTVPINLKGE